MHQLKKVMVLSGAPSRGRTRSAIMEYRRLGQAGVKVSPICLGAGVRGQLDEERFIRTIEYAIDLGCNFIDCANNYGKRQSEILLGQAIKGKRDNLVLTSKV